MASHRSTDRHPLAGRWITTLHDEGGFSGWLSANRLLVEPTAAAGDGKLKENSDCDTGPGRVREGYKSVQMKSTLR